MNAAIKNALYIGGMVLLAGCAGATESMKEATAKEATFIAITVGGKPAAVKAFTAALGAKKLAQCEQTFPPRDEPPPAAKDASVELEVIYRCDRSTPPDTFGAFGTAYVAGSKEGTLSLTMSSVTAFSLTGCPIGCVPYSCFGQYRCWRRPVCMAGVC